MPGECGEWKRLCKNIGMVVRRGDLANFHNFIISQVANVCLRYTEVLGRGVVDLLGAFFVGSLIIGAQRSGRLLWLTKIT